MAERIVGQGSFGIVFQVSCNNLRLVYYLLAASSLIASHESTLKAFLLYYCLELTVYTSRIFYITIIDFLVIAMY